MDPLISVCVSVCLHSDMKNAVIGNNKQKANLIVLGAVPRYVCIPFPITPSFSLSAHFLTCKYFIQRHSRGNISCAQDEEELNMTNYNMP